MINQLDEEFLREKLIKKNQFDEIAFLDVLSANPLTNAKEYCGQMRKYAEKRKMFEFTTEFSRAIIEQNDIEKAKDVFLQFLQLQTQNSYTKEISGIELKIKKNNTFKKQINKLKNTLNNNTLTPGKQNTIEKEIKELEQKIDRPKFRTYSDVREHFKHRITSEDIRKAKEVNYLFDFVIENEIALIAAKPGTGKTFLSLTLAQNFANRKNIAYIDGDNSLSATKLFLNFQILSQIP